MIDFAYLKKHIVFPVWCDEYGMYIFDKENNMIMDVRGWGRLQYLPEGEGERVQKATGDAFAEALNDAHNRYLQGVSSVQV